jgi:hypothetical protein
MIPSLAGLAAGQAVAQARTPDPDRAGRGIRRHGRRRFAGTR